MLFEFFEIDRGNICPQGEGACFWGKIPKALFLPEDLWERKSPPEMFASPSLRFLER